MARVSETPFILCVPRENRILVCLVAGFQIHVQSQSCSQLKAPCLETIKTLPRKHHLLGNVI